MAYICTIGPVYSGLDNKYWCNWSHILLIVGSNSFSYAIISLASVNQGSLSICNSLIQDASYQKVLVFNLICLMKQCIVWSWIINAIG